MKKNKIIKQNLDMLADEIQPENLVLVLPAIKYIRERKKRFVFSFRKLLRGGIGAAVAAIILITAINVIPKNSSAPIGNEDPSPITYRYELSELDYSFIQLDELDDSIRLLDIDEEEQSYLSIKKYLNEDENSLQKTVMYGIKYKTVTPSGTDLIIVYADIGRGMKDYTELQNAPALIQDIAGTITYENGEYYTNAYFTDDFADYYVFIMSPDSNNSYEYLYDLFG